MLRIYKMQSMRSSPNNNPVRITRRICGVTQAELADLLRCARLTVHTLEAGRLKLSQKMAERISLHTGVSKHWLLNPKRKLSPVCERDSQRPFTLEVFKMTRAEFVDPRIEPLDVVSIKAFVAAVYRRLCDTAWQAYRADKVIYFYFAVREFLEALEWKDSGKLPNSADVGLLYAAFAALMEQTRKEKEQKIKEKS
jgi:plasmid maintenance system antidote protein VapI